MKHISLDREDKRIRDFARSVHVDPEGTLVELEGELIFRIVPANAPGIEVDKLKAAILKRRAASRKSNKDWEAVDRETWEQPKDKHE
jgi:hypothetical protein